jgi:hypothetical protein
MSGKDLMSGQCTATGPSPKHGFWWPIPAYFQACSWVGQGAKQPLLILKGAQSGIQEDCKKELNP